MRVKILALGLACLFFIFTVSSQELEKYTLSEIASLMDSIVEESGGKIKTVLKKENDVVNFYVDTQVKDFTSSAKYTDYKIINGIVIATALIMTRGVSWKSDKVWFLRDGEKVAWISVDRCKTILDKKSKSPSYLFERINLVDIDHTVLHQIVFWSGSENDSRTTKTFTITTATWRIWWDTEPGKQGESNFQIYVHKSNGDPVDVAANVIGKSNQFTIIREKGKFYLKIITGQPYMITVYEERERDLGGKKRGKREGEKRHLVNPRNEKSGGE